MQVDVRRNDQSNVSELQKQGHRVRLLCRCQTDHKVPPLTKYQITDRRADKGSARLGSIHNHGIVESELS